MATILLFRGSSNRLLQPRRMGQQQPGVSLIELIVVLFIIGLMMSFLLPALQSARAKAASTACQNNVRQVGFALGRFIEARKRFPLPHQWTVDILKWLEEDGLASQFANGVPQTPELPRPPLLRCPGQPEVNSTVPSVLVSHYLLVVNRPLTYLKGDRVAWEIHDRPLLTDDDPLNPWYIGPEIDFAAQKIMFEKDRGPHPGGVFLDTNGQVRGGAEN